ncbi:glycoside hydrolase [Metschnikowia bicuspidata]|uniref:Glycoside hydrolase n=1 Tax=Metschnikowia bicuspidata TaxID=27322 RepID=A0A4P9ZGE6_9ASCO|nr:glycoside hydrolase [Metschnikowia bicuspidata]
MATVATPASQAAATAAATTSSNGGWFSELVGSLFGDIDASSSAPAASTVVPVSSVVIPPQSSTSPSFGLSTAQADSTDATNSEIGTASSASAGSSKFVSLSSQIQAIVGYAEGGAGITYSPYTKSGSCKSAGQVKHDILLLLAFKIIRMYSVDCSGIAYVVAAMGSHQKLFLGIWEINAVNTDLPSMAQQVLSGSRGWSAVHTVAIGNEVIDSGRGTINQVANAISAAGAWFELNAPSYKGPIVTVDTLTAVLANPGQMCDLGDYLAVNCHPYFSRIEASTSGTWLRSQVAKLQQTCGSDRTILVTESGWPTSGKTVDQAVPSLYNQLLSIKSIANVMGDQLIMFTMYNDYWKDPGAWNVEQHWGLFGDPSA